MLEPWIWIWIWMEMFVYSVGMWWGLAFRGFVCLSLFVGVL